MVAATVLAAPTPDEVRWLSGSTALAIVQRHTGQRGLFPSPQEAANHQFTSSELALVNDAVSTHLVGEPDTVVDQLEQLQQRTGADELMLSTRTHSFEAREQSFALIAASWSNRQPSEPVPHEHESTPLS
jgi:alkanesulfonate monooxygenase SsuD/methylene tetrahydromethanopterin reductase-like flavin-dependent oxidoreductase (luciferase family)